MPRPSPLYAKPPEASAGLELPLKTLSERFEVSFAEFGVLWVCAGIGQRHEDHPPLERPEGSPVDACETKQQVPSACPGETPYLISGSSTTMPTGTEAVTCLGLLE